MKYLKTFLTFAVSVFLTKSNCTPIGDALVAEILQNGSSIGPPPGLINGSVYFALQLWQIQDIEMSSGLLKGRFAIAAWYDDANIYWNPHDYEGNRFVILEKMQLWKPDLLPQDASDIRYLGVGVQYVLSTFHDRVPASLVMNSAPYNMDVTCGLNAKYFPWDEQVCELTIGQWYSRADDYILGWDVKIQGEHMVMNLESYRENDQWTLKRPVPVSFHNRVFNAYTFPTIKYTIYLQGKSEYFVKVIVCPTILLSCLSVLTFFLPPDSGEKVSLGITILLSHMINLFTLSDILPASSSSFSILGDYFLMCIFNGGISLIGAVIVLNFHHHPGCTRAPHILRKMLLQRKLLQILCVSDANNFTDGDAKESGQSGSNCREIPTANQHDTHKSRENINVPNQLEVDKEKPKEQPEFLGWSKEEKIFYQETEWKMLASVLDKIFAYIMLILTVIFILYIFISVL